MCSTKNILETSKNKEVVNFRSLILEHRVKAAGFAVRNGNKSPNQETDLGNRGQLKVLNDIKSVINEHE